jgi:hypothetical protein
MLIPPLEIQEKIVNTQKQIENARASIIDYEQAIQNIILSI